MTSTGVALEVYGPRNVIHETAFQDHGEKIFGNAQRLDEFLEGIDLVLAREPTKYGQAVRAVEGQPPIYALKTREVKAWPSVLLVYSFTATHVTLIDISEIHAPRAPMSSSPVSR